MTNYNERFDKVLISFAGAIRREVLALGSNDPSYDVQPLFSPTKQAITSLIKELVAEAKPELPALFAGLNDIGVIMYKKGTDEFEQNLLKALEEV